MCNKLRPSCIQQLVESLSPGDVVVIDSLDRLGRDRDGLVDAWRFITKEKGADMVVLDMLPLLDTRKKEQDLTASFVADLVLQILSYVSEKERQLNRERSAAGIAAAKLRGVVFGRKPLEQPANFEIIRDLWKCGEIAQVEAARRLGISRPTFVRWLEKD